MNTSSQLIEAARAKGLPVIYTTGERRPDNWDAGSWRWKSTRGDEASGTAHDDIDGNEIVTMIAPGPRDIVIKKQKPSGFFGTNLASYLTLLGCDSVIVVGTTTSGCVRATVVDAFSLNYRVILAEEGCFDRSEASHAVSLCDMHAKYADVLPTARNPLAPQSAAFLRLFSISSRPATPVPRRLDQGSGRIGVPSPPGDLYSAATALCGSGFSSRKRGRTSFANSVMFATVSSWSRKPPWPNINRWPKPPTCR